MSPPSSIRPIANPTLCGRAEQRLFTSLEAPKANLAGKPSLLCVKTQRANICLKWLRGGARLRASNDDRFACHLSANAITQDPLQAQGCCSRRCGAQGILQQGPRGSAEMGLRGALGRWGLPVRQD